MELKIILVCILTAVIPGEAADFGVRPADSIVAVGLPHTLRCSLTGAYHKGQQHVYWAWTGSENQQKFISVDRALYPAVDAEKRNRYSITGNQQDGEFNLHISPVSPTDQGQYRCILYDSTGSSRASASLVVQESRLPNEGYPKCSITPPNPQPGDYATLACISAGGVPPATLSWSRGNKLEEGPVHHNSTDQQTGAYLHHLLSGWENNVTFTCTSRSHQSTEFGSCSIVPFAIPTHVTILSPQMVTVGSSAEFFCLATSVPSTIRYRWFVGRGKAQTRVTKTKGRFLIFNQGASLRILDISLEDNEMPVRCVARNPLEIKAIDETLLRVVPGRNHLITTQLTTKPQPITTSKPLTTTQPQTPSMTTSHFPATPKRVHTVRMIAGDPISRATPKPNTTKTASELHPRQTPSTEPPSPTYTTNKMEDPVSVSPPLDDITTSLAQPDLVQQPGPRDRGTGSAAGAAVGFTVLIVIILVLAGILIKIKIVDKKEKPSNKKKSPRPAHKPRIDKLDIVVVPNAPKVNHNSTGSGQDATDGTPPAKQKQGSVKSGCKRARGQSFVHPDFLEQLASTIRSKSHCSSMFKRGSFSWRKRKAATLDRPAAVHRDATPADKEASSTVKRYSAFFNAVPPVPNDELPAPSIRQIQKAESVYENTEIGQYQQEDRNDRCEEESLYENTQYRETVTPRDHDKRKSEASSLLNLVYADLDWTGFPGRDSVHEPEEKTEYAAIRTSQAF